MKRVRAIIITDNKILVIRRTKPEEVYWVFPGGGAEEGESDEAALLREGKEELGATLAVKELLTELKFGKTETMGQDEFFYYCDIVEGELGTGKGPEFQIGKNYIGSYDFEWVSISILDNYDLRPKEVVKLIQS